MNLEVNKMKKLPIIFIVLLFALPGWAATWYVTYDATNGGNKICYSNSSRLDSASCAENKTFTNLWASITAGDNIELDGGASGLTYLGPIYPTKSCNIYPSTETGHTGNITIGPPASKQAAITIDAVTNVTVTGPMTVEGYNGYGLGTILIVGASSGTVFDLLTIKNNYAFATARGFYITATGAVTGAEIKNCTILNPTWDNETLTAIGIEVVGDSAGWNIHHNTIGGTDSRFSVGIRAGSTSGNNYYNNIITYSNNNVAYPGGSGKGISVSNGTGNQIYNNAIKYCYEGITNAVGVAGGNYYYYNLIAFTTVNSISIYSNNTVTPEYIYNNTIIHTPTGTAGHGITHQVNAGRIVVKNNLVYGVAEHGNVVSLGNVATDVVDTDNNLYYTSGGISLACKDSSTCSTILSDWQASISSDDRFTPGKDMSSVSGDPLFIDADNGNYRLRAGSPAINAGVDVGLTTDADGKPIIGLPDIGAYEYQPTATGSGLLMCQ